jgi:hypothetical protein
MADSFQGDDARATKQQLLARLAIALAIDPAALYRTDPLEPVQANSSGLNGHKPVELALSQALDRMEEVDLRDHLERLLRTLEVERERL